jgi:hypothetical protein
MGALLGGRGQSDASVEGIGRDCRQGFGGCPDGGAGGVRYSKQNVNLRMLVEFSEDGAIRRINDYLDIHRVVNIAESQPRMR